MNMYEITYSCKGVKEMATLKADTILSAIDKFYCSVGWNVIEKIELVKDEE